MTEFALITQGVIVGVVTSDRSWQEVNDQHPDHEVKYIYQTSQEMRSNYEYWME